MAQDNENLAQKMPKHQPKTFPPPPSKNYPDPPSPSLDPSPVMLSRTHFLTQNRILILWENVLRINPHPSSLEDFLFVT